MSAVGSLSWLSDADGALVHPHTTWQAKVGTPAGAPWFDAVHPEDRAPVERHWRTTVDSGGTFIARMRLLRRGSGYLWVRVEAVPADALWLAHAEADEHQMATVRHQEAEAAARAEERFRLLAENMSQFAWMADSTGSIFWYNRRWYDYTGTTFEEMKGWGWRSVHHPDHIEGVVRRFRAAIEAGRPWEDTFPLRSAEGEYRWFLSRALPIRDEHGQVKRWFGTNTDITEERALAEALREADRRKDAFLATLAHELRNPLAPLRSGLELLEGAPAEDIVDSTLRAMRRHTDQLVRLVDDLLQAARINRGRLELRPRSFDVAEAIEAAVDQTRERFEGGPTLVVHAPPAGVQVVGDPERLAQVMANLLDNAAKFTPSDGRVDFEVRVDDAQWTIEVRDTGVGLDPASREGIFEMFAQVTRSGPGEGLGIGLSLVRHLAQLHGGTAEALSDGPGQGATLRVVLPNGAVEEEAPEEPVEEVSGGPRKVLIVDDNTDAAELLALLVQAEGHEVRVAHDGVEACEVAEAFRPALVLMDLGMPRRDGIEAAQWIRARPWGRRLRLVALTGWGLEQDRERTRDAGFDDHLVKPAEVSAVKELLGSL